EFHVSRWSPSVDSTGRPDMNSCHVRATIDAATIHSKTNRRHRRRIDRPDGDYVASVHGNDAKSRPSARRAQHKIYRSLWQSGADDLPVLGPGVGEAPSVI